MTIKEQIEAWVGDILDKNPSLFLIDLSMHNDQVKIILDGDEGVALKDCVMVSRAIENELEEREMDLSIEVSSAGVSSPLQLERQYKKNLGRKLEVLTGGTRIEGTLTGVSTEGITLEWKAREKKPVGKGKITVEKKRVIPITDIEEAKVKVTF